MENIQEQYASIKCPKCGKANQYTKPSTLIMCKGCTALIVIDLPEEQKESA